MRNDDRHERHRGARPDMLDRIEERLRLARERERIPALEDGRIADLVGAELARLRDPGAEHAFTEAWSGQEPLLAGERIRLRPSDDGRNSRRWCAGPDGPAGALPGDMVELEWLALPPGREPEEPVSRISGLRLAVLFRRLSRERLVGLFRRSGAGISHIVPVLPDGCGDHRRSAA